MLPRIAAMLLALLSACATHHAAAPPPEALGNRIRVRIEGREVDSITSADYFLYLMVRAPDGKRTGINALGPESVSAPGMALGLASIIRMRCDLPNLELIDPTASDPKWSTDIVLPPGYTLCCEPGSFYAYRIIEGGPTMAADLNPEVRISAIRADGTRYFEVPPSDGPLLKRAAMPPGWPLKAGS
tara:strand:- start:2 stop:559 length:558 start_codon:yes stop_codon:yes gene_type:complete